MIKAAIFDVDGVIADSEPLSSLAYEAIIKAYGKTPIYDARGLVFEAGVREKDTFQAIKKDYGINEDIEILMSKRNEIYKEMLKELIPQPGLIKLLQLFKVHNILLGIASSGVLHRVHTKLKTVNVFHFFDKIVSGEQVEKSKPAPDIFLEAARQLEVDPKDSVVFEDAELGVIAAEAAGMKVIAVPTEYTKAHDFSKSDIVVNSLDEVTWEMIQSL